MKFRFGSFLSGFLAAGLIFSISVAALAASGNVSFNISTIKFNGQVISNAGEDYTLDSGARVPASLTYTDENGGGTTYLPVRRIGELAGVKIGWDGAVTVKSKEFAEQEKREAERAAALDTSTWSDEKQAAYQEFKAMWDINPREGEWGYYASDHHNGQMVEIYDAEYTGSASEEFARNTVAEAMKNGFCHRLAAEVQSHNAIVRIWFYGPFDENGMHTVEFDVFDASKS